MKKIIVAITMILSSFAANAAYCDGKGAECWHNAEQASMNQVQYYYLSIMKMPLNEAYKEELKQNQQQWLNAVGAQCRTAQCVCASAKDRLMFLLGQQQRAITALSKK